MRNRLAEWLGRSRLLQSVAWVVGGSAAGQAITILIAPAVTRLYSPTDFGTFSVFSAIVSMATPVAGLAYSLAIPLPKDDETAINTLALSLLLNIGLSLGLLIVLVAFRHSISELLSIPNASSYMWLLSLSLLGGGAYQSFSAWALRRKEFRPLARTRIWRAALAAAVKVGLGVLHVRPLGLLLGLVTSQTTGAGTLIRLILKKDRDELAQVTWKGVRAAAKRFSRFPLVRSWSRLLVAFSARIPVLLLAAFYGAETAGFLGLSYSIITTPAGLVGTAVRQVIYAQIAGYGPSAPTRIRRLMVSVVWKLTLLGALPAIALLAAGPWLFKLVFGTGWATAGEFSRFLGIAVLARFASGPVMSVFDVLEKPGTLLLLNGARATLVVLAIGAGHLAHLTPLAVVGLYSLALVLGYTSSVVVALRILKRRGGGSGE